MYILRTEVRHHHRSTLIVEVSDEAFQPAEDPSIPASGGPRSHGRALRLTWDSQIFALESYDEFYAGPIFAAHSSYARARAASGPFVEIISDPDP